MTICPNPVESSDAVFFRALGRKALNQGIPLYASIELTERCNLSCVHCYLGDQKSRRKPTSRELNVDGWRDILEQIAAMGSLYLLITGGEPLLHPDFVEVYRHAKKLGLLVTVFTNGTLIDEKIIGLFRELPPYSVEVTIYGATAETYENVTGAPGSYQRCMRGIKLLRSLGLNLGLKAMLLRENQHELDQIAELGRNLGTKKFRLDVEIQATFDGDQHPISHRLAPDTAVKAEFSCQERAETWRSYYDRHLGSGPLHSDQLYACGAGKTGIHITPYGHLQPCLAIKHISCDLLQGRLIQGLESIRRELSTKRAPTSYACNNCELRTVCSACPAFELLESGHEQQPGGFQCHVTRLRNQLLSKMEGG